jgi:hypothetical protein
VTGVIERGPRERLSAWLVTGPLGHLYGTLADITLLWVRWGVSRVRARVSESR